MAAKCRKGIRLCQGQGDADRTMRSKDIVRGETGMRLGSYYPSFDLERVDDRTKT